LIGGASVAKRIVPPILGGSLTGVALAMISVFIAVASGHQSILLGAAFFLMIGLLLGMVAVWFMVWDMFKESR